MFTPQIIPKHPQKEPSCPTHQPPNSIASETSSKVSLMAVSKLAADMSTPVPTRAQIKTWPDCIGQWIKSCQVKLQNLGIYMDLLTRNVQ